MLGCVITFTQYLQHIFLQSYPVLSYPVQFINPIVSFVYITFYRALILVSYRVLILSGLYIVQF